MIRNILILMVAALLAGCAAKTRPADGEILYTPKYAQRFELRALGKDSVMLVVKDPWQGSSGVSKRFGFAREIAKEGHPRVICMSTSHTAFLEALGCGERVVGVSGRDYMHSVAMQTKPDVGYDRNLDYEKIVSLQPDMMMVYEVAGENSTITRKLEQLGVPMVYIADYLEADPLGRAEWIVALGALMGKQQQAEDLFDSIATRYNAMKTSVLASSIQKRPRVMLNSPYRDVWYLPGDSSYMVRLITDAGGDYLGRGLSTSDQSLPVSTEKAYTLLRDADLWLNPATTITTRADLLRLNKSFSTIKARVYNSNARSTPVGGSDFWESGVLRPDIILSDLSTIFRGDTTALYYFKELR